MSYPRQNTTLLAALAALLGLAFTTQACLADDVDPEQVELVEAYHSTSPPFLLVRVKAKPGAPSLTVGWRQSEESYFVTHPERPNALVQLSPLDGPLDVHRAANGIRTRMRIREWNGPVGEADSRATDYLVLRPSPTQGTRFTPQVLVFSDTMENLDRFFADQRDFEILPRFHLMEMEPLATAAFWKSVTAQDYALELLPDPRRVIHSFSFTTENDPSTKLIVDVPQRSTGLVGARIRLETADTVRTLLVDKVSSDGQEFYTESCGILRSGRDYGAFLEIQPDGSAIWHMDRFAPVIPLTPDIPKILVDGDNEMALFTFEGSDAPHSPLTIRRPSATRSPPETEEPADKFLAYANEQGLLFLELSGADPEIRDLIAPGNEAAREFLGTKEKLAQVLIKGLSSTFSADNFEVSASFRLPTKKNPDQTMRAEWNPQGMTWNWGGKSVSLSRLTLEQQDLLIEDIRSGKLQVSTISRNFRTPRALARTPGANPSYFYWDIATNGTMDYRFFFGKKGQLQLLDDDTFDYHHLRDGGTLVIDTGEGLRVFLNTPTRNPLIRPDAWLGVPPSVIQRGASYFRHGDGPLVKLVVTRNPTPQQVKRIGLTPQQQGRLEPVPSPCADILLAIKAASRD